MTKKIKITLVDNFSGCIDTKIIEARPEQLKAYEHAMVSGAIIPRLENGIKFHWVIEEIENLTQD